MMTSLLSENCASGRRKHRYIQTPFKNDVCNSPIYKWQPLQKHATCLEYTYLLRKSPIFVYNWQPIQVEVSRAPAVDFHVRRRFLYRTRDTQMVWIVNPLFDFITGNQT